MPGDVRAALEAPDTMELVSLEPSSGWDGPDAGGERLHAWLVIGRAEVSDPETRAEVARLVLRGVRESEGMIAACFNPRHAVRVTRDGVLHELVICYECYSMAAYVDGEKVDTVLTSESPGAPLTALFRRQGLEVAP